MRPAPELLEAAAHWYVALRDADADDPARTAWRRWLEADARHRQAWERMLALQQRLGSVPGDLLLPTLRGARRRQPAAGPTAGAGGRLSQDLIPTSPSA